MPGMPIVEILNAEVVLAGLRGAQKWPAGAGLSPVLGYNPRFPSRDGYRTQIEQFALDSKAL